MPFPRVLVLSLLLHLYVGVRLIPALPGVWPAVGCVLLLVTSAALLPMGFIARRLAPPPLSNRITWAGMLALGLFSSLIVLTLARDVLLLIASLGAWLGDTVVPPDWRSVSAALVPSLAIAFSLVGLWNAKRTPPVRRRQVPIAGLPPQLHGFRIAHITDIHVSPTIRAHHIQALVDRVNSLHPDVVAITGDLVDGTVPELAEHVAPLGHLRSRHGSYFVTGNHEYYAGVHPWLAQVRSLGIRVLLNEHVVLQHGGAQLVLAGVPDFSAGHFEPAHAPDAQAALRGAPGGAPRVLLAHQPRFAPAAADAGVDLQLSGHTHGGQFFPWIFFVPLQQPFTAGLHRVRDMWVYVSRGTGYWGPPKRLGAPSEITELELILAPPGTGQQRPTGVSGGV